MNIIITASDKGWDSQVDPRFGRAQWFLLYREESGTEEWIDNRSTQSEAHGAGTKAVATITVLNPDVIITGNGPGGNARSALGAAMTDIAVGAGGMTIRQAYEAWKEGRLRKW